jgi:hypothetical protein
VTCSSNYTLLQFDRRQSCAIKYPIVEESFTKIIPRVYTTNKLRFHETQQLAKPAGTNRDCWADTQGGELTAGIEVDNGKNANYKDHDYYEIFVQELKPAANHSKSIYATRKGPNVIGYWHNPNIEPTVDQFFQ